MAKSKKQEPTKTTPSAGGDDADAAKTRATRTSTAPKARAPAGKQIPGGAAPGAPLIDTSLAAAAAANMVLNRAVSGATGGVIGPAPAEDAGEAGDAGDKRETSTFKQLKQSLSKQGSQGLGGILGVVQAGKKSNQPFGGGNQVGRNQTFGSDAARINVPRRTGG